MPENFNETIAPGISFSLRRGEILIHHSTIQALGNPCFIRFLLNREKGTLAIQRSDNQTIESFLVPSDGPGDWDFRIYSEPLLKILWQQCDWDQDKTYRCYGSLYSEYNIVEFDLQNAEIVMDDV